MAEVNDFEDSFLDLFAGIEDDQNNYGIVDLQDGFPGENGNGSDGETSSSGSSVISNSPPVSMRMTALPALMPCFDLDSNQLYLHSSAPLLSKSNKRMKRDVDEDRLIKNRESANRSRMKRKNEKLEMEETIGELKSRIRTLELENTALVTDNASLHNQNLYLRSLLSVSGITVLCLVCMCTVFNEWLPPALRVTQSLGGSAPHRPSGRVLLSMHDTPSIHMTSPYSDAIESSPQSYLRMGLLCVVVLCYFGYHQYLQRKAMQKNGCVLP
jgi:hypothetical protein